MKIINKILFWSVFGLASCLGWNSWAQLTLKINELSSVSVVDAVGRTNYASFNSRGQVIKVTTPAGLESFYSYDSNSFLQQVSTPSIGRTNTYSFTNGHVSSLKSPLGLVTTYQWDNLNRLVQVGYPDGTTISNSYDRLDLSGTKDRLGRWTHATYDSMRHRLSSTDRNGHTTTLTYCDCGALESVTDPLGGQTVYTTDLNGRFIQVSHLGSGRSYTATRNLLGQVTGVVDSADLYAPYGFGLQLSYNIQGLLTNVAYNNNPLYQASYDIYDRLTTTVDANGITVTNAYDPIGRLSARGFANGGVEQFVYSVAGLSRHYDSKGQTTSYRYDLAGRLTAVTNANLGVMQYGYDAANHLLSLADARNNSTTWSYDQYGRPLSKTDGKGVMVWTNGYNANGWVTKTWTPVKGLATIGYDSNGNATNYASSNNNVIRVYDAINRPTRIDYGNIRLAFAYTNFAAFKGAMSSESAQPIDGSLDPNDAFRAISYGYQNEQLLTQVSPDQTVSYAFDWFGRLLGVTNSDGTFSYGYNSSVGNQIRSLSYPSYIYSSDSLNYDAIGSLTNTEINLVMGTFGERYETDLNGNRLHSHRHGFDFNGNAYGSNIAYGYDALGQLTSALGLEDSGTARLNEQFGYGYDPAGNLLARTNGTLVQNFVSDPANELTNLTRNAVLTFAGSASTNLFNMTVNGQPAEIYGDLCYATTNGISLVNGSNSFTVVASDTSGNWLTNIFKATLPSSVCLAYDLNGNLTSDGVRHFDFDDFNQLVRVMATNLWKVEYDYDGLNRHHVRRDYTWRNGAWLKYNTCYYVYAGNRVVEELSALAGYSPITYTWGADLSGTLDGAGGVSGLLERHDNFSGPAFYHADANGNVTLMFDQNGQVLASYLYDPFGNVLAKRGRLADLNRYRFSSKEFEPNSGLYYYGYRYYEPNQQRWLNRDPIQERGGRNLYGYVENNPINGIDPLGLLDYYNSTGGLVNPSGPVPYLEAETWYGNIGAQTYNTIPFAYNGLFGWMSDIGTDEGAAYGNGNYLGMLMAAGIDTAGMVPGEGAGVKCLRFGKLKVANDVFHLPGGIKSNILKKAGKYWKKVGNNPNVKIVGDKIWLTGNGPFKGETFKTELIANDFFPQ